MVDRRAIQACESAVLRDLWRPDVAHRGSEAAGTPSTGPGRSGLGGLSPREIWTGGGFSGWYDVGTLADFQRGWADTAAQRRTNQWVRDRLGLGPGQTHLVYRLMYPDPARAGVNKAIYVGSAKYGDITGRLRAHYDYRRSAGSLLGGSRALHGWLRGQSAAGVPAKDPAQVRVQAGYATGQGTAARGSRQDDINYNELFLIEKILQRRYRPTVWDPNDRSFDESRSPPAIRP